MDIQKKMKWATMEEQKVRDFEIYINDAFIKAPEPPMEEEEEYLKVAISELEIEVDDLNNQMDIPDKAKNSLLGEIYKMPGSILQLKDLLKSQDVLDFDEKEWIMRNWRAQVRVGGRAYESSEPLDDSKSREFLREKAVGIAEHREEFFQILPRLLQVNKMLESANSALYSILRRSSDRTKGSSKIRETKRKFFFEERGKNLRENKV